jgi:dolichol-phosphate mannosyltransferase
MKTLLIVPTYNESGNVPTLCQQLLDLRIPMDILFIDDKSPDGTGQILDQIASQHPQIRVIHREGKLGLGSAHQVGIDWAYDHGYEILLSMDADFTHPPHYLPLLLELGHTSDVVVTSRFLHEDGLPEWNLVRRFLTHTGHILTKLCLGMPYDATGALRLYRLDKIPRHAFKLINASGYSFFFESLHVLFFNGFTIREIPIQLPARAYGSSKMTIREVFRSVKMLFLTLCTRAFSPAKLKVATPLTDSEIDPSKRDPQNWDTYWSVNKSGWHFAYDVAAALYRKYLIGPSLDHMVKRTFKRGDRVLHAGCGGGEVDIGLHEYLRILPLDISVNALNWYRRVHGDCEVLHGSIFQIPLPDKSLDGVYNLGVMEHFTDEEITAIFREFRRVLKDDAKILLFWPPEFGLSVRFIKGLTRILQLAGRKDVKFHPDEITRVRSREHVQGLLRRGGFELDEYNFGARDLFTQVMLVGRKLPSESVTESNTDQGEIALQAFQ